MNFEKTINKTQYITLAVLGMITVLLAWSLVTYTGLIKPFFLPTPTNVVSTIGSLLIQGSLLQDSLASISRILLGFLLSLVVSVPFGVALGTSKRFEALTEPLIAFVRYIPPSAFIPLAIIWFGIGELEKVAILFLGVAPYLILLIADIVKNTRRDLVEAALTLGASRKDIIAKVIIPSSMPGIWDSFRIMIGAAWTFVIIAEIVGASSGLGHLMVEAQRFLRTDSIFAGIVVIGLLGLATDYSFKITYKTFFPWMEQSSAQ